ncbi:MmcQ/YjbR family DNA-binding protein [Actibacterium lipolyticum]|uniref:MmcQ/YjbR family DNA-binding protein n=1 Tax=Actibacterium lipolyticum TaxID=1524263 RepID=A0A238KFT6_9RHOB|nr:MmcQ/YjbR family DNA-binding protein [Actibacterium lipolyticum]SMX41683.1 hypothetical protein COL8621_01805 [Actibacterium lipolyticum]
MDEIELKRFCDALPGAVYEQPFGPDVGCWKVAGKIFALCGHGEGRVSVKCADPEKAAMLIDVGRATKAPYLPRGGWVSIPFTSTDPDEVKERLSESYQTIRSSLSKKIQASLG